MVKPSELSNKDLLNKLITLYGINGILLDDEIEKYAEELEDEVLSRMIDSNAENFKLFGVKDKSTGKLVSDITNPRHKYWESEKRAQSAINGYNPIYVTQRDRKKHNKEDLEVVEIKCVVQEK